MDFFEHQDQARRNTRFLIFAFIGAAIAVVFAVDLVVSFIVANVGATAVTGYTVPDLAWAADNAGIMAFTSVGTGGFIGLASLYRTASLSGGGGKVATSLGGTRVTPDTRDFLAKRLHNVVEEMAIASGVPVPEVYVLEQEAGINAFAAGLNTADAAIAVTRGTLENLDRQELQGVVAHEFSHVLNGDMRLNMRLIGVVFGILVIGLIGRTLMRSGRGVRVSSSKSSGGISAVILIGLMLFLIGYVGVFMTRLMKAAVSRQREYLADASAVQFTRDKEGIAGALKKIGGYSQGSQIKKADTEEVAHMLFSNSRRSFASLLATHPPLPDRIRALDPQFDPSEFEVIARELAERPAPETEAVSAFTDGEIPAQASVTPGSITAAVGNPDQPHFIYAAKLRQALPASVTDAAHAPARATLLILGLIVSHDEATRQNQLSLLRQQFGDRRIQIVEALHEETARLGPRYRLPLLELAFPAIKQRPREQLEFLLDVIEKIIHVDGAVDVWEYTIARVLRSLLRDAETGAHPMRRRFAAPSDMVVDIQTLLSVVARHGHATEEQAAAAFGAGMTEIATSLPDIGGFGLIAANGDWLNRLDRALEKLDGLKPADKETLIAGLVTTVMHDTELTVDEAELLRSVCATLHCPLPPILLRF